MLLFYMCIVVIGKYSDRQVFCCNFRIKKTKTKLWPLFGFKNWLHVVLGLHNDVFLEKKEILALLYLFVSVKVKLQNKESSFYSNVKCLRFGPRTIALVSTVGNIKCRVYLHKIWTFFSKYQGNLTDHKPWERAEVLLCLYTHSAMFGWFTVTWTF